MQLLEQNACVCMHLSVCVCVCDPENQIDASGTEREKSNPHVSQQMGKMLGYFNAELNSNKPASTHSKRGDVWLCAECNLHSKILRGSTQMCPLKLSRTHSHKNTWAINIQAALCIGHISKQMKLKSKRINPPSRYLLMLCNSSTVWLTLCCCHGAQIAGGVNERNSRLWLAFFR